MKAPPQTPPPIPRSSMLAVRRICTHPQWFCRRKEDLAKIAEGGVEARLSPWIHWFWDTNILRITIRMPYLRTWIAFLLPTTTCQQSHVTAPPSGMSLHAQLAASTRNSCGTRQHASHTGMKVLTSVPPAKNFSVASTSLHVYDKPIPHPTNVPSGRSLLGSHQEPHSQGS